MDDRQYDQAPPEAAEHEPETAEVDVEALVEDISIDGMCGVY